MAGTIWAFFKKATEKNGEFSHDPVVTIDSIELREQPAKRAHVFPDSCVDEEGDVGTCTTSGSLFKVYQTISKWTHFISYKINFKKAF